MKCTEIIKVWVDEQGRVFNKETGEMIDSRTDWDRINRLTEKEIYEAAMSDPDALPRKLD